MANSLFNLREMRPEPLRPKMQFGFALTLWLCVNEEPPLVAFERQSLSCTGLQRQPPPSPGRPRPTRQVPSHCGQITERCQHITFRRPIRRPRLGPQLIVRPVKILVVVRPLSARALSREWRYGGLSVPSRTFQKERLECCDR